MSVPVYYRNRVPEVLHESHLCTSPRESKPFDFLGHSFSTGKFTRNNIIRRVFRNPVSSTIAFGFILNIGRRRTLITRRTCIINVLCIIIIINRFDRTHSSNTVAKRRIPSRRRSNLFRQQRARVRQKLKYISSLSLSYKIPRVIYLLSSYESTAPTSAIEK